MQVVVRMNTEMERIANGARSCKMVDNLSHAPNWCTRHVSHINYILHLTPRVIQDTFFQLSTSNLCSNPPCS